MSTPLPDPSPLEMPELEAQAAATRWAKMSRAAREAGGRVGLAYLLGSAANQILGRRADPFSVSTSYVILRNGIGVLGFALPIVMVVGGGLDHIQASLSAYYHYSAEHPAQYGAGTMRDVFVGMLCAIGAFLFFYRGHSLQEDVALNIAGIAAVLIALFPMDWPANAGARMSMEAKLHTASATAFFVMIAYVCVFRARDTLCLLEDPTQRRPFERIYLGLGILMLATPATVTLLEIMSTAVDIGHKILIVEAGGVFVFASFWLIKSWEVRSWLRREVPV